MVTSTGTKKKRNPFAPYQDIPDEDLYGASYSDEELYGGPGSSGETEGEEVGPSAWDRLRGRVGGAVGRVRESVDRRREEADDRWGRQNVEDWDSLSEGARERLLSNREEVEADLARGERQESMRERSLRVDEMRQEAELRRVETELRRGSPAGQLSKGFGKFLGGAVKAGGKPGTWKGASIKLSSEQMKRNKELYLGDADKNLYYAKYSSKKSLYLPSVPTADKNSLHQKAAEKLRASTLPGTSLRDTALPSQSMRNLTRVGKPKSGVDYAGLRKLSTTQGHSPLKQMMMPKKVTGPAPTRLLRHAMEVKPVFKQISSPAMAASKVQPTLRRPASPIQSAAKSMPISPIQAAAKAGPRLPSGSSPIMDAARNGPRLRRPKYYNKRMRDIRRRA